MAVGALRIRDSRGWLVRMDPELMRDIDFHDRCCFSARMSYVGSMFYIASRGGPDDIYPHAEVVAENGTAALTVASQLLDLGIWIDCGLGYQVVPYAGWRVVPEKRSFIPRAVRAAVYARDQYSCRGCGSSGPLTLDHVRPWSLGGSDEPDNLQTLCQSCNSRKGART